jgi:hypothetical protein
VVGPPPGIPPGRLHRNPYTTQTGIVAADLLLMRQVSKNRSTPDCRLPVAKRTAARAGGSDRRQV